MLLDVDIIGANDTLSLTLGSLTDPIQIKGIDGLDPVKASITTEPYGVIPGEILFGKTYGKRNIVFKFGLNPDWATQTIAELRNLLYQYFMPTQDVTLRFNTTHITSIVAIDGTVEDMLPDMFSADPEISVSIICPQPDFVAVDEVIQLGTVFQSGPFATIDANLVSVENAGSVPTGVKLKVESNVANPSYTGTLKVHFQRGVDDLATKGKLFDINYAALTIDATKYTELKSVLGDKYVRSIVIATGIPSSLLGYISDGYTWPILYPGMNRFGVQANSADAGQKWTLSWFPRYGGL